MQQKNKNKGPGSESGSHSACKLGKMVERVVGLGCYGLVLVMKEEKAAGG